MRTLYLDGTVVRGSFGDVKPQLAEGAFERAIRAAGFERLVCVGNAVSIIHLLAEAGHELDGHEMRLKLCGGAFANEAWFRTVARWVLDPRHRVRELDFEEDWYYVDDMAERYFALEGRHSDFTAHRGGRIWIPGPDDDGGDTVMWLRRSGDRSVPTTPWP